MLALNADKDYPPLFPIMELAEEEQKCDTDILNSFFQKVAQSASIRARNGFIKNQSGSAAEKVKKMQQTEAIAKDLNLSPNGGQQEKQ